MQYSTTSTPFTLTYNSPKKENKMISHLDITVHKTHKNINISIFRKTTFTGTLIPYTSNDPTQQKYAAITFLYNRLNSYHLHRKEY